MTKQLILGGARSGKSVLAEQYALESGKKLLYVATAEAADEEMAARIAHHQQRRGEAWTVVEEPIELLKVLKRYDDEGWCILVDCLTLWLCNCMGKKCWVEKSEELLDFLLILQADIIFVSNEVGSGVVPVGELSRQFVDESGRLHQRIAQQCSSVKMVFAGLALELKQ